MLTFELVSPERKLASIEADSVTIPGMEGEMTVMGEHAPFLTTMRPGAVVVRTGSAEKAYIVTGGFAEISDNVVSVLAERAVDRADMNDAWIDAQIAEAEQAAEDAGDDRKAAARQRVNDFLTFKTTL